MSNAIKNNGGPAFPTPDTEVLGDPGMSLRDWFATNETLSEWDMPDVVMSKQAGELLAGECMPEGGYSVQPLEMLKWEAKWRAALKYIRADAMLAERFK